jgi:hypothetical protein
MWISDSRLRSAASRIFRIAAAYALHENAGNSMMWMASSPVFALLHFEEE